MYTIDELTKLLEEGTNPEDLLSEFSKAVKEASRKLESDKAKIQSKKIEKVSTILGLICDLLRTYYPSVYSEDFFKSIDPEKVVKTLDESYTFTAKLSNSELDSLLEDFRFKI